MSHDEALASYAAPLSEETSASREPATQNSGQNTGPEDMTLPNPKDQLDSLRKRSLYQRWLVLAAFLLNLSLLITVLFFQYHYHKSLATSAESMKSANEELAKIAADEGKKLFVVSKGIVELKENLAILETAVAEKNKSMLTEFAKEFQTKRSVAEITANMETRLNENESLLKKNGELLEHLKSSPEMQGKLSSILTELNQFNHSLQTLTDNIKAGLSDQQKSFDELSSKIRREEDMARNASSKSPNVYRGVYFIPERSKSEPSLLSQFLQGHSFDLEKGLDVRCWSGRTWATLDPQLKFPVDESYFDADISKLFEDIPSNDRGETSVVLMFSDYNSAVNLRRDEQLVDKFERQVYRHKVIWYIVPRKQGPSEDQTNSKGGRSTNNTDDLSQIKKKMPSDWTILSLVQNGNSENIPQDTVNDISNLLENFRGLPSSTQQPTE